MTYTLRDESAAQPERSRRPHNLVYQTKLKERTMTSGVCLESAFPLPGPAATIDRAARAARRRRSGPRRCLSGGAAILPPKSSPPGESVVTASWL